MLPLPHMQLRRLTIANNASEEACLAARARRLRCSLKPATIIMQQLAGPLLLVVGKKLVL